MELHVLALANVGIGEERVARKMIHRAMVQVIYAAQQNILLIGNNFISALKTGFLKIHEFLKMSI